MKRPATQDEIAWLVSVGYLKKFKSDGPTDFGAHILISALGWLTFTRFRKWASVVRPAAREHDWDYFLGELSGKSRAVADAHFHGKLKDFPWLAEKYKKAVTDGGNEGTGWWGWRYGWKDKSAILNWMAVNDVGAN